MENIMGKSQKNVAVKIEGDVTTVDGWNTLVKSVRSAYNRAQKAGETQADRLAVLTFEGMAAGRISDKPSKADKEAGVVSFVDYAKQFTNRLGKPHSRKDALLWVRLGGALALGMDPASEDYRALKSGKRALNADLAALDKGADGGLTPEKVGNIVAGSKPAGGGKARKNKRTSVTGASVVADVKSALEAAGKRYEKLTVNQRETIEATIETYRATVAATLESDAEPETATG